MLGHLMNLQLNEIAPDKLEIVFTSPKDTNTNQIFSPRNEAIMAIISDTSDVLYIVN